MSTPPYTDKEKEDIDFILDFSLLLDRSRQIHINNFNTKIDGDYIDTHYILKPPVKCGDGKKRYTPMEYLDYLFQDPSYDDMLEAANAKTTYQVSYTLGMNGIMVIHVVHS